MSAEHHNYHFLMNEQSFTWLFNAYWEKVYSICYQNTNSHEDSRELTQNIFKSLWERRNDIKITGNPEHYLMRSAKLQVINFYRDNKIQEEYHNYFYQAYCDIDHCTENEVLFNQLNDKLGMLVDSLPCQCKNIYQLSRENNLSNKQIADVLGISVKTVEYHLANASKLLKNSLKDFI
jgi:RNA polymerase sigma-70 factor (family 1)